MKKASNSMLCSTCKSELKRQILGTNVFYYCRKCGCLSSELFIVEGTNVFHSQATMPFYKTGSVTDLKLFENS